ncbi:MAG: hypothetical protein OXC40_06860 [Proteobacteria bacterium]|nr:hypothetical protein [Pseudomonadota bacterium]
MFSYFPRLGVLLLSAVMMVTAGGCEDKDLAEGAAAVAVVAGVVALISINKLEEGSSSNDESPAGDPEVICLAGYYYDYHEDRCRKGKRNNTRDRRCDQGYRYNPARGHCVDDDGWTRRRGAYGAKEQCRTEQVCKVYYDRYGSKKNTCRNEYVCYDAGTPWHYHDSATHQHNHTELQDHTHYGSRSHSGDALKYDLTTILDSVAYGVPALELISTQDFSYVFEMSEHAASDLLQALDRGREGDLSALESLGFTRKVLWSMTRGTMPDKKDLHQISQSLAQDPESTPVMMTRFITTAKELAQHESSSRYVRTMALSDER